MAAKTDCGVISDSPFTTACQGSRETPNTVTVDVGLDGAKVRCLKVVLSHRPSILPSGRIKGMGLIVVRDLKRVKHQQHS